MRKSYHQLYKYLILYIVLSFIDNKYIINCQKIRNKMKFYDDASNEIPCENGVRINVTDSSTYCNYTALAQKSDFNEENHSRKYLSNLCCAFSADLGVSPSAFTRGSPWVSEGLYGFL